MFDPDVFGPGLAKFLAPARLPPLGPGCENLAIREALESLCPEDIAAPGQHVRAPEMAHACLAGLWLYHDFLDRSHALSQELETATGSFWHGMMHRREPDPGNAKYWFRRVGDHPVFPELQKQAAAVAVRQPGLAAVKFLTQPGPWDPFAWIDLCEQARRSEGNTMHGELVAVCREISLIEWQLLFEHSFRMAVC